MKTSVATPAPQRRLTLPEVLDATVAKTLAETLVGCRGEDVTLDSSFVQQVSEPCLEVLRSAQATWTADSRKLTLLNCPPRFIEDLRGFGG